jgi:signal peptidase I
MEPTLHCARPAPGCEARHPDRLLVEKVRGAPRRGDIIVFRTPHAAATRCGASGTFVKRLIGLPGEVVSERDGYVYIDGKRLEESYIKADRRDHEPRRTWRRIPPDHYFVMGDNRPQSCDSRVWGSVPRANFVGDVVAVFRQR